MNTPHLTANDETYTCTACGATHTNENDLCTACVNAEPVTVASLTNDERRKFRALLASVAPFILDKSTAIEHMIEMPFDGTPNDDSTTFDLKYAESLNNALIGICDALMVDLGGTPDTCN